MSGLPPFRKYLASLDRPVEIMVDSGDGKAEKADALVCADFIVGQVLLFPDNLVGRCSKCGAGIQYRPHAPKKPKRFCYKCVPALPKDGKLMVTAKTAMELGLFWHKGSKH